MKDYNVAIVGATGLVGREFARILVQRNFPMASVRLMASHRSAGKKLSVGEQEIEVEETTPDSFRGVDIALFSAGGDASRHFSPIAAREGTVVVDNCLFTGNESGGGGGIWNGGTMDIGDTFFTGNLGTTYAGVIQIYDNTTFNNIVFAGNQAGDKGGAIVGYQAVIGGTNITAFGNNGGETTDAAISVNGAGTNVSLTNSIFWNL